MSARTLILFTASTIGLSPLLGCPCTPTGEESTQGGQTDLGPDPEPDPDPDPDPSFCSETESDGSTKLPKEQLCSGTRRVVPLAAGETCPDLTGAGWHSTTLLDHCVYAMAADVEPARVVPPDQFAALAVLNETEAENPFEKVWENAPNRPVADPLPDCRVLPLGDPHASEELLADFSRRTALLKPSNPLRPVLVAVIDTAPVETRRGAATHGRLIAAIVRDVSGGVAPQLDPSESSEKPFIEIGTWLGLPRAQRPIEPGTGGYFGSQAELAIAIDAVVQHWQTTRPGSALIINLSVGWEPLAGVTTAESLVVAALARAACHGALIIAAAGNQPPQSCAEGLMGPAFFSQTPGPKVAQCTSLGIVDAKPPEGDYPLVYPITALDDDGTELGTNRPNANSPLAALGRGGISKVGTTTLGPMSGSSVAAAVVSGLAARTWAEQPEWDANRLMHNLYDGGTTTTRTEPARPVIGFSPEQHVLAPICPDGHCGQRREILQALWGRLTPATVAPHVVARDCKGCGDRSSMVKWSEGVTPPPGWTALDSWVIPQPGDPPCPSCGIKDDVMAWQIEGAAAGETFSSMTVTIENAVAIETIHYGAPRMSTGGVVAYPLTSLRDPDLCIVDGSGQPPTRARIDFVVEFRGVSYTTGNTIDVVTTGTSSSCPPPSP